MQFPIGVFGVALSVAALPVFSRHAARKDFAAMRRSCASSLVMVACLALPATVGLMMLAAPIIRVIFEHGAFTAFDTSRTAEALACYALGLFAYSGVKIMVPAFYALQQPRYPVFASFLAVAANITIILFSIDALQHRAIALATSAAMTGSFLLLGTVLYRKLGGFDLPHVLSGFGKVALASAVMGGWLRVFGSWWTPPAALGGQILFLAVTIGSAALIYGVTLHLLAVEEFRVIINKVQERIGG